MEGCSDKSDYISKPSCTQELDVLVLMQSTSGLPGHWELKGKDNSSRHMCSLWPSLLGFPCDSAGKESACNVGDLGSIPGLGRSPGDGKGYPLQYSWATLVAQLVKKNPPAMWETWIWSSSWEDPLEKGKATHSIILAWRILWTV